MITFYPIQNRVRTGGPLADFRREMDRLFDETWSAQESTWNPACEVEEEENHYLLSFDVPGVERDHIKIEASDGQLSVTGERQSKTKKKQEDSWYSERRYGKFTRTFTLPKEADASKIEAHFENGILRVYIPKSEAVKPRQITISGGDTRGGFFGKLLGRSDQVA